MAKEPVRSTTDQAIVDYLELKYPGITHDCLGYQHVKRSDDHEQLTVNLLIDKNPTPRNSDGVQEVLDLVADGLRSADKEVEVTVHAVNPQEAAQRFADAVEKMTAPFRQLAQRMASQNEATQRAIADAVSPKIAEALQPFKAGHGYRHEYFNTKSSE